MAFNKEAEKDRKKGTALLPAMGFVLIVAYGVIGYFISPYVQNFLVNRLNANITGSEFRYVVAFAIFIVLVLLTALVYAVAMPRPRDNVKDGDIAKERKAMEQAKLERKARRRKVKKDMNKM
ncbi:MAG: hypothetical protein U0694_17225 [Anaerolineae bacterium]